MNDLRKPYDRIQRFADTGIVNDVQLESARIEALCQISIELRKIRELLEEKGANDDD